MTPSMRNTAAYAITVVATLWWIVIMIVQRAVGDAPETMYWLRDVRWLIILTLAAIWVWAFEGDRFKTAVAGIGLIIAFGADLLINRLELPNAGAAVLLLLGSWVLRLKRGNRPSPLLSAVAAAIAGAGAAMASFLDSSTEQNWSLFASVLVLVVLLTVLALGSAIDVGGLSKINRVVAGGTVVAVTVFAVATRTDHNATAWLAFIALSGVLVAAVSFVTMGKAGWVVRIMTVIVAVLVAGGAFVGTLALSFLWQPGHVLAVVAGNPTANPNTDSLSVTLMALVIGLVTGGVLAVGKSLAEMGVKKSAKVFEPA